MNDQERGETTLPRRSATGPSTSSSRVPLSGRVFVFSGPSGVGKSSLLRRLGELLPRLRLSVSCTTRLPRTEEKDGREYFFVTQEEFAKRIAEGRFLEWAEIHGQRYGTDAKHVSDMLTQGYHPVLDIDVKGAAQVRAKMPEAVTIFVRTSSLAALAERLEKRSSEDAAARQRRLGRAQYEMTQSIHYQHVLLNDQFDEALAEGLAVLRRWGV